MTKATLQAIVYTPLFVLIIYLVFFYKWWQINKNTSKTEKSSTNNIIKDKKMINNNIKQISLEEFKKEMQSGDTILIDIRTPMEWERYGIIPWTDKYIVFWWPNFELQINELDKTKKYLLYCFHWNRSDVARNYMQELWFTRVKDLAWWIKAWYKAGEKIEKKEN